MAPLAVRRGALPRRASGNDAALWRYVGLVGRAWRLCAKEVPHELREKHAQLLLAARDWLFPHVGSGREAGDLLAILEALAGRPATTAVAAVVAEPFAMVGAAPTTPQPGIPRREPDTPPKRRGRKGGGQQEEDKVSSEIHAAACNEAVTTLPPTRSNGYDAGLRGRMRNRVRDAMIHRGLALRESLVDDAMEEVNDATPTGSIRSVRAEWAGEMREFISDAGDVVEEVLGEFAAWRLHIPYKPLDD